MPSSLTRAVFPDRPPTKADVVTACAAAVLVAANVPSDRTAWGWAAVGVVVAAIVLGPVAQSSAGRRLETAFRDASVGGRLVVIAVAVVVWIPIGRFVLPSSVYVGVSVGFLAVIPPYVLCHLLVARELGGWRVDTRGRSSSEGET